MRVGFLGCGEIAAAMVMGLAGQGHQILISRRNEAISEKLKNRFQDVEIAKNEEVVEQSDVVILCLMAPVARDILQSLPWRTNHKVISVMADISLADLGRLCAPVTEIALTIPLSPIATGGSALPVYPASSSLETLFGNRNTIISVPSERALNAYFAGSALSAPLIDLMKTGADWLAAETGDKAAAEAYVAGVFAGFMRQMHLQGVGFDKLLQALATEGGLNASLKSHIEKHNTHNALRDGLDALKPRLGLE